MSLFSIKNTFVVYASFRFVESKFSHSNEKNLERVTKGKNMKGKKEREKGQNRFREMVRKKVRLGEDFRHLYSPNFGLF